MEIVVDRDGKLFVKSPRGCETKHLKDFIKEKEFWVYTKLAEKDLLKKPRINQFKNGEKYSYLGKNYTLSIDKNQILSLRLDNGHFSLIHTSNIQARKYFVEWYTIHAKKWILKKIPYFETKLGIRIKKIRVLDLGNRWGSCSADNTLNFHWRVILCPSRIVEYIIAHEMVHIIEKKHTPEFWKKLEKIMPDYMTRKQWLAANGSGLTL